MKRQRVAIYCRLSDEDRDKRRESDDSESIQNQKNLLLEYAVQKEWELYRIYCDEDFSGADAERPDYNELLFDAENKKFDIVLCKAQSRFTRDIEHVEKYINNKFLEWGVRFVGIVDNADTEVKGNKKSRQINGLVNEWYLEDVSDNVKAALGIKMRKGQFIGAFAPYGYLKDPEDKNHLIPDPEVKGNVQRIFDMYLDGYSLRKIAFVLNEENIPCPLKYKREVQGLKYTADSTRLAGKLIWTDSSVSLILKNQTYVGDMVQSKTRRVSYKNHTVIRKNREDFTIVSGTHVPLVSKEQFDRISEIAGRKMRPTKTGRVSLFAGILRCGSCQSSMVKCTERKSVKSYRCGLAMRNRKVCEGVFVNEQKLIDYVLNELKKNINRLVTVDEISGMLSIELGGGEDVAAVRKKLSSAKTSFRRQEKALKNLYLDKVDGIISKEEFFIVRDTLSREREAVKTEIYQMEERLGNLEARKELLLQEAAAEKAKRQMVEKYLEVTELKRDMVLELIDYIEVHRLEGRDNKKIVICWKF